jgi:lipopolysaccharide transport system ATP-binding protein
MGDHSYHSGEVHVNNWTNKYKVIVGKYCSIAWGTRFILDGDHDTRSITTYPLSLLTGERSPGENIGKGDIVIGNDVWIGFESVIMSGVHIGDGAVIGARSVVTHDIGDYEIVAGNPARHIRYRFTPEEIVILINSRWWDWPPESVKAHAEKLRAHNVQGWQF